MTSKMRLSLPSPAVIVAALALVAALAGTAIAAPEIVTKKVTTQTVKKISTKQAKKQIAQRALSKDVVTRVESDVVPDGGVEGAVAVCDPGETMIGGGASPVGTTPGERVVLVSSGPVDPAEPLTIVPPDGTPLTAWGWVLPQRAGRFGRRRHFAAPRVRGLFPVGSPNVVGRPARRAPAAATPWRTSWSLLRRRSSIPNGAMPRPYPISRSRAAAR